MTEDASQQTIMIGYQKGSACVVINGQQYNPATLAQEFRRRGKDAILTSAQTGLSSFIALNGRYRNFDFLIGIEDARKFNLDLQKAKEAGFHLK